MIELGDRALLKFAERRLGEIEERSVVVLERLRRDPRERLTKLRLGFVEKRELLRGHAPLVLELRRQALASHRERGEITGSLRDLLLERGGARGALFETRTELGDERGKIGRSREPADDGRGDEGARRERPRHPG